MPFFGRYVSRPLLEFKVRRAHRAQPGCHASNETYNEMFESEARFNHSSSTIRLYTEHGPSGHRAITEFMHMYPPMYTIKPFDASVLSTDSTQGTQRYVAGATCWHIAAATRILRTAPRVYWHGHDRCCLSGSIALDPRGFLQINVLAASSASPL